MAVQPPSCWQAWRWWLGSLRPGGGGPSPSPPLQTKPHAEQGGGAPACRKAARPCCCSAAALARNFGRCIGAPFARPSPSCTARRRYGGACNREATLFADCGRRQPYGHSAPDGRGGSPTAGPNCARARASQRGRASVGGCSTCRRSLVSVSAVRICRLGGTDQRHVRLRGARWPSGKSWAVNRQRR